MYLINYQSKADKREEQYGEKAQKQEVTDIAGINEPETASSKRIRNCINCFALGKGVD